MLQDLARHVAVAATRLARVTNDLRCRGRRTIVAREHERHRIQRDLHPPCRTGARWHGPATVGRGRSRCASNHGVVELLTNLRADASRATEDLRRLVRDLRPAELEEIGLTAAVETAAARMSTAGAMSFKVEAPLRLPALPHGVEDAVYHVCLEAMSNALRHSSARHGLVRIGTAVGGGLEVSIDDDGIGIAEHAHPGTGLVSMNERVGAVEGRLLIGQTETGGTRISMLIPVEEQT